jgi:hypothetical protein
MQDHLTTWETIYAMQARAQEVRLEAEQTRWWAALTRQQARLLRLARSMPGANHLTLEITAKILAQRGLLAHTPSLAHPRCSSAPRARTRAQPPPPD